MGYEGTCLNADLEKVLFHETTILSRLDTLARQITIDYQGKNLTVVPVLHGGLMFAADLLRRVQLPLRIEAVSVSSYYGGTESSGEVTFNQIDLPGLEGEHVLLLDDILDSGRTLAAIRRRILRDCRAESVRVCVLFSKRCERAEAVDPGYIGFEIGDEFVVGYGLDYRGRYRNLPLVGTLKPEMVATGEGGAE